MMIFNYELVLGLKQVPEVRVGLRNAALKHFEQKNGHWDIILAGAGPFQTGAPRQLDQESVMTSL